MLILIDKRRLHAQCCPLFIFDILSNVKMKLSCNDPKLIIPCPSWVLNAGWSPGWTIGGLVGFTLLILLGRITQICLWSDSQRQREEYMLQLIFVAWILYVWRLCVYHCLLLSFSHLNTLLTVSLTEALIFLTCHNFKARTQQCDSCNYTKCTNYSFGGLRF